MKEIKIIIKTYMLRRDVTMEELAKAIGITTRTISNYFKSPDLWRLGDLHRAYGYLRVPEGERRYE